MRQSATDLRFIGNLRPSAKGELVELLGNASK
jgi:hypothetical protein